MVQIVIDAPGTRADTASFFERALVERGWTSRSYSMGSTGGFQQPPPLASTSYFCRGDDATLSIQAQPRAGRQGAPDVRVSFMAGVPPCLTPSPPSIAVSPYDRSPGTGLYQNLPTLYPPEGVTIRQSGSYGGSTGSYGMEARATTSMGAAELETFFSRQLAEKGWTRENGSASGPIAWSVWVLQDLERVQGFLSVRELPGADQRILSIRIDLETDDQRVGSGGYYGYPYYTPPVPASPRSLTPAPNEGR